MLSYSPDKVDVIIAGILTLSGYLEGSFISLQKEESSYKCKTSLDGNEERIFTKSNKYKLKISLMQSSSSNEQLSLLHTLDTKTHAVKLPIFIKDSSGNSIFFSEEAWIENYPSVVFSSGMEGREWSFECCNSTIYVAGNDTTNTVSDISSKIAKALIPSSLLGG